MNKLTAQRYDEGVLLQAQTPPRKVEGRTALMTQLRVWECGLVLSLALSLGSVDTAKANDIRTFKYFGFVTELCGPAAGCRGQEEFFSFGDPISLQFSFDATTPDARPELSIGRYENSITSLTLVVGEHTFTVSENVDRYGEEQEKLGSILDELIENPQNLDGD